MNDEIRNAERLLKENLGHDGVHSFHPTQAGDGFIVYTETVDQNQIEILRNRLARAIKPLMLTLVTGRRAKMA